MDMDIFMHKIKRRNVICWMRPNVFKHYHDRHIINRVCIWRVQENVTEGQIYSKFWLYYQQQGNLDTTTWTEFWLVGTMACTGTRMQFVSWKYLWWRKLTVSFPLPMASALAQRTHQYSAVPAFTLVSYFIWAKVTLRHEWCIEQVTSFHMALL